MSGTTVNNVTSLAGMCMFCLGPLKT